METLKSVFLFKELSLGRLIRVLNIASIDDYEAGSRIIARGDKCEGVYIVLDGRLEVAGDGGVEGELAGGQCFGVTSLLRKHTSSATVEAAEPSRVLFIRGRDFDNLTRRWPKLGRLILRRLALHLSERLQRLTESRFDPESTDHRLT
jgi:CRP-like cAMP-binding protein